MPKYYKRTTRRGSRDKYSVEQTLFQLQPQPATTTVQAIVPPSDVQGMRKVKHLTISANVASSAGAADGFLWALFYLPHGMTPPGFSTTSGSPIVEPNQFVMNCGVFDPNAGPLRVSSPVSRNLNSGDQIVLLVRPISGTTPNTTVFTGVVRYAITLN